MTTQRQQVLEFITAFPVRDDDEIAAALKFSQRQTVNIICRALAAEGRVDRTVGPRGKLVNVLRGAGLDASQEPVQAEIEIVPKPKRPTLNVAVLIAAGFQHRGDWTSNDPARLRINGTLPQEKGVYAFASGDAVMYVGVAGMGLKKRLYFYENPGAKQATNVRINDLIRASLLDGEAISVYTATPPDFDWGGLAVNGRAGLEIGLIESFYLPWNVRGSK